MKKRLFVYSVDAMVQEDVAYLRDLPDSTFAHFCEHSSGPESVCSVYPSLTYPAHVAIQTGCYPEKNGVYTNYTFSTDYRNRDWTWDARLIQSDNIFSAAKRGGYTTSALFWPVTSYNSDIDFHMPEYWLAHPGETLRSAFSQRGASPEMLDIMEKYAHLLPQNYARGGMANFAQEPQFDNFLIHVTCDVIRQYRPEVMFIHGSLIDSLRHEYGVFSPEVLDGLQQVDRWLSMLFQAFREAGTLEDTNFVILSDHGQLDYVRESRPNAFLADRGFIRLDEQGCVTDYTAYGIHNGLSMTFWLKDPSDQNAYNAALAALRDMAAQGTCGFTRVFTRQEAMQRYHLNGNFSFIVEGDGKTYFTDACTPPYITSIPLRENHAGRGNHGHLPGTGPQPIFLAKGPDFRSDILLPRREIVDEAPTFARLLGVDLRDAQGIPMTELLRN